MVYRKNCMKTVNILAVLYFVLRFWIAFREVMTGPLTIYYKNGVLDIIFYSIILISTFFIIFNKKLSRFANGIIRIVMFLSILIFELLTRFKYFDCGSCTFGRAVFSAYFYFSIFVGFVCFFIPGLIYIIKEVRLRKKLR